MNIRINPIVLIAMLALLVFGLWRSTSFKKPPKKSVGVDWSRIIRRDTPPQVVITEAIYRDAARKVAEKLGA